MSRVLHWHGRWAVALVVAAALGPGGCKKPASVAVPLRFRPTSQLNMNTFAGALPQSTVHVAPVADARDNRDQIGENLENRKPIPIYAQGAEPMTFVHDVMHDLMTRAGITVTGDGAAAERIVVTDLHRFWTQETNTYEAEVRATIAVQDRGGRQLWKGTVNGTAERFGRSLKAENYQEVFSDAMIDLVEGLLNNAGFRAAIGGTGAQGVAPAGAP